MTVGGMRHYITYRAMFTGRPAARVTGRTVAGRGAEHHSNRPEGGWSWFGGAGAFGKADAARVTKELVRCVLLLG